MISGSNRENTHVGCFFVDVNKRQLRRIVRKDIFTVLHAAKKNEERDFPVRPLDALLPSPPKSSATVKSTPCIHDVILQRNPSQQRTDGELFNRTPMRRGFSS